MDLKRAIQIARQVLHGTEVDQYTRHQAYLTLAELHPIIDNLKRLFNLKG